MTSLWQHIDETAGKESEFSIDVVSLRNIYTFIFVNGLFKKLEARI